MSSRPASTDSTAGRRRRFVVELAVGAMLALAGLLAMLAGGSLSVSRADARAGERPALILQCPLGVHRLSAPPAAARRSAA